MKAFASLVRLATLGSKAGGTAAWQYRTTRAYSSTSQEVPLPRRRTERVSRNRLPDKPARTRFAPSPTGYLHLGSLRTALYNYLLARTTNGQFLLRLEDTDQSRIVPDAEARLYEDLKWAGLSWDEGPDVGGPSGPYKQSERLQIYQHYANILLGAGRAFRCFCSHEDLSNHHHKALESDGMFGSYPGRCLSIPSSESDERAARGEAHTIRFRSSPSPPSVHDIVYGLYKKKAPEDHFIIMKTDGFPTYHFANVVDDHLMGVTHVVRGAEWLISTAKHVSLYDAFGWEAPSFAHVGLLVDSNRQKLSKRNMDIGIDSYQRGGILPPALLNFSALLGWSPSVLPNKGIMDLDDMVKSFGMKFTKGDIVVNMEKLAFLNRKHIQKALSNSSHNNNVLIDKYLAGPVLKRAREVEAERQRWLVGQVPQTPGDVNLAVLLGKPIVDLTFPDGHEAGSVGTERIRNALKISRNEATTAADIVDANRYLIWQPPVHRLEETLVGLVPKSAGIFINQEPSSVAESLRYFIDNLGQIEGTQWSVASVQPVLDDVTKRVVYCEPGKTQTTAGYKFLRWALLGLDNGPQMSHLMEYLGRAETLTRLHLAGAVIGSNLPEK